MKIYIMLAIATAMGVCNGAVIDVREGHLVRFCGVRFGEKLSNGCTMGDAHSNGDLRRTLHFENVPLAGFGTNVEVVCTQEEGIIRQVELSGFGALSEVCKWYEAAENELKTAAKEAKQDVPKHVVGNDNVKCVLSFWNGAIELEMEKWIGIWRLRMVALVNDFSGEVRSTRQRATEFLRNEFRRGNYSSKGIGMRKLKKMIGEADQSDCTVLYYKGLYEFASHHDDKAVELLLQVTTFAEDDVVIKAASELLGDVYEMKGAHENAIEAYERAGTVSARRKILDCERAKKRDRVLERLQRDALESGPLEYVH